jgi:FkbM family methyltransferase
MPVMKYRSRTLTALSGFVSEIVYVMCGARGETSHPLMRALPQVKFIGFEPDAEEHARLASHGKPGFVYLNAAVARRDEARTLYITRNPGCSSLLPPNHSVYGKFKSCDSDLEIVDEKQIETVSLDAFLPRSGVSTVDFLDLDTQGSELEILQGAESFLSTTIVGVKCEVEFASLYQGQALFGDVDKYLRQFGYMLFDLSRSRYRRVGFPPRALTRGQLLWGDAIYLKDYTSFRNTDKLPLFKLCLLAAHLQFHDYALEVLRFLLSGAKVQLSEDENAALHSAEQQYLTDLRKGAHWLGLIDVLRTVGLGGIVKEAGRLATQLGDRLRKDSAMAEYNWVD